MRSRRLFYLSTISSWLITFYLILRGDPSKYCTIVSPQPGPPPTAPPPDNSAQPTWEVESLDGLPAQTGTQIDAPTTLLLHEHEEQSPEAQALNDDVDAPYSSTPPNEKEEVKWPRIQAPNSDAEAPLLSKTQGDKDEEKQEQWPQVQLPKNRAEELLVTKGQIMNADQEWTRIESPKDRIGAAMPLQPELQNTEFQWPRVTAPKGDKENDKPSLFRASSGHSGKEKGKTNLPPLQKGDLVMITASSGTHGYLGVPGLREQVYENRRAYAERWGHEFMWADMSSYDYEKVSWNKIPIIKEAHVRYPNAKWFWWLDADIIIMNITVDIYSLVLSPEGLERNLVYDQLIPAVASTNLGINTPAKMDPEDVNCIITFDDWGLNTGSYLLRRGPWTDLVLDMWSDPLFIAQDWVFFDQDGWVHLYTHHEFIRKHTGIVWQTVINAYAKYNVLGAHWKPGDLLVHFPGCGSQSNFTNCRNHWDEYWEMRHPYQEYDWIRRQIEHGIAPIETVQKGVFKGF